MTTKRIIGMVLMAAAALFGLADLWRSYFPSYGDEPVTMGRLWLLVSARSLAVAEDVVHRRLWAPLWDLGISPLLVAPAWSFCAVLGMVLIAFGRSRTAAER